VAEMAQDSCITWVKGASEGHRGQVQVLPTHIYLIVNPRTGCDPVNCPSNWYCYIVTRCPKLKISLVTFKSLVSNHACLSRQTGVAMKGPGLREVSIVLSEAMRLAAVGKLWFHAINNQGCDLLVHMQLLVLLEKVLLPGDRRTGQQRYFVCSETWW
jgi:hypothetical protein